jgi:ribose transport system substrate-binding protein
MKKSLLVVVVMVLAVMFVFVACTTKAPDSVEEPSTDNAAEAPEQTQDSTEDSEAPADDEAIKIGMSTLNLSNPFFVELTNAAKAYGAERNVEILINDSEDKIEKQVEALENFIASGCKAIIVTAVDPEAILPVVQKARAEGIVVVAHTSKLEEYDAWVAADEYEMGYTLGTAAGKWIAENWGTDEPIEAGVLNYDVLAQVINRKNGIIEGVQEFAPNVTFVADATAGDPQTGMDVTESFIQANPNLRVVLGINDGGTLGAYEAFMAAGMDGDEYLIGGIDATPEGIAKVAEGGIFRITVDQAPSIAGAKCVELALAALNGEEYEKDYLQDLVPVTAENIADYVK